jgi:hypothetical protein
MTAGSETFLLLRAGNGAPIKRTKAVECVDPVYERRHKQAEQECR